MKRIKEFLRSSIFIRHLLLSILAFVLAIWFVLLMLDLYTRHGDYIKVPDLREKSLRKVTELLDDLSLDYNVIDSVKYNPEYPKFYVLEQTPEKGASVKKGRIIYLKINPTDYRKIKTPNIINITRRNAEVQLVASGLKLGTIKYVNNIAKDVVLQLEHKGKKIYPGDAIKISSTIDLVCGNGNISY